MNQIEIYDFMKSCHIRMLQWTEGFPNIVVDGTTYYVWYLYALSESTFQINIVLHDYKKDKERNIDYTSRENSEHDLYIKEHDFLKSIFTSSSIRRGAGK